MYKRLTNQIDGIEYKDIRVIEDNGHLERMILELSFDYSKEQIINTVNKLLGDNNE